MLLLCVFFPFIMSGQVFTLSSTTYTPNGSEVILYHRFPDLSEEEKEDIRSCILTHFPNAYIIDEATRSYNCHDYAWVKSMGGPVGWMNPTGLDRTIPHITDGSYTNTSMSDPKATHVWYMGDDHSARVFNGSPSSRIVISKWGDYCLVRHNVADCMYYSSENNLRYYKLSMYISGDEFIQLPSPWASVTRTYTIENLPPGATPSWSVSGSGQIVGSSHSQSVNVLMTGGVTIRASFQNAQGINVTVPYLDVAVTSAPLVTDIQMFQYCQNNGQYTFKAVTTQDGVICTWSASGPGNVWIHDVDYPDDAIFIDGPNLYKAMDFERSGTYIVTVRTETPGSADAYEYSKTITVPTGTMW